MTHYEEPVELPIERPDSQSQFNPPELVVARLEDLHASLSEWGQQRALLVRQLAYADRKIEEIKTAMLTLRQQSKQPV